jgi:threonylcarbamoyladenosine tRNA methylthiotransferase MtaB
MPKFKITTLGCKVNQYDSDAIAKQLESFDWLTARDNETPEICIINTCTVTHKAGMQSRQAVRQAMRANPTARIVVTGCYAQTQPQAIAKINGVHHVIGNADKHRLYELIGSDGKADLRQPLLVGRGIQPQPLKSAPWVAVGSRTRPFFKIQDGCNAFCTYCIVPYARGPSRSLPVKDVLRGIQALSAAGYQETVLAGIHLGNYGRDLNPQTNLCQLLDRIHGLNLIERVRLTSIEPLELTDDIINRVAESAQFCQHFHIPLQSGDDRILRKMGRPYTALDFRQGVEKIHERLPHAAIGVDTLIGFPGETDEAFEATYALIEELPVGYLHVFPFSSRPGTPAAGYPGKIPSKVIKQRCKRMRDLGNSKRVNFYKQFIGKEIEVLVESTRHKPTGLWKGLSSNYLPILFDADNDHLKGLISIRVERLTDSKLLGTLV